MKASDAVAALLAHRTDEIAFCALGMAAGEWWRQSRDEGEFYLHGALGFSASMALGFALMLSQAKVCAIKTDGSLCMTLGGNRKRGVWWKSEYVHVRIGGGRNNKKKTN